VHTHLRLVPPQDAIRWIDQRERAGRQESLAGCLKRKVGHKRWAKAMWSFVLSCVLADVRAALPCARWLALLRLLR
jgi:hypothetical protein